MLKKDKKEQTAENQDNRATNNESTEAQNSAFEAQNESPEQGEELSETDKMSENNAQAVLEWQDKYVRLSAEFDNFRKRTLKEKSELIENGGADVLRLTLSTADDFDRALQHITDENAKAGVEMIYNKFLIALRSKGVEAMDILGKPFDVDFAEAIAKVPATSEEQIGTIMDVAEKGYMIGDKVLRFAKVVVYQ